MSVKKFNEVAEHEWAVLAEMRSCVHFNGVIRNESCKAGVEYHALMGNGLGCFNHLPCLSDFTVCNCPAAKFPTREKAEHEVAEMDRAINQMLFVVPECKADAKAKGLGRGNGGRGELSCPTKCGGTVRYSVAAVNGHMWGKCSTEGCVSWME